MAKLIGVNESFISENERIDCFYAFFLCNDRLYSVHRRHRLFSYGHWPKEREAKVSEIILSEYEEKHPQRLKKERSLGEGNDPRVISDGESAYIIVEGAIYAKNRYTLIHFPSMRQTTLRLPEGEHYGKNWQPILENGELFICNSISPFTLFKVDMQTGQMQRHRQVEIDLDLPALHDRYSILRGGSNALINEQDVIGWGHATTTPYQHIPFVWRYNQNGVAIHFINLYIPFQKIGYSIVDPVSFFEWDKENYALSVSCSQRDWFHPQWFLNGIILIPKDQLLKGEPLTMELGDIHNTTVFHANALDCLIDGASIINGGRTNHAKDGCLVCGPSKEIPLDKQWHVELCYSSPHGKEELVGDFDILLSIDGVDTHAASCQLFGTEDYSIRVPLTFKIGTESSKGLIQTRVFTVEGKELTTYFFELIEVIDE
jgi:hypothetical protein